LLFLSNLLHIFRAKILLMLLPPANKQ
jgi:hypothetical protein